MEVIILAIIGFIFSAISKRKQPNRSGETTKPFMPNQQNQQSRKKIEDYAKEIYNDMQRQYTGDQSNIEHEVPAEKVQEKHVSSKEISRGEPKPSRRPGRLKTHQTTEKVEEKSTTSASLVPSTENELIQAIIFSEIMAPPKSKR